MPRTNCKALVAFLKENAKNEAAHGLLPVVTEIVRQYGRIARKKSFPLVTESELDHTEAANVIKLVTGEQVGRIQAVSVSAPYDCEPWLPGGHPSEALHDNIDILEMLVQQSIEPKCGLFSIVVDRFADEFWEALGEPLADALLDEQIDEHLFPALQDCFFWDSPVDLYGTDLWANVRVPLFYLLGFMLVGDERRVGRFVPLMRFMQKAIPVGEKADEPGTWLVLVA